MKKNQQKVILKTNQTEGEKQKIDNLKRKEHEQKDEFTPMFTRAESFEE